MRQTLPYIDVCLGTEEEWWAALALEPDSIMAGQAITDEQRDELAQLLEETQRQLPQLTMIVKCGAQGVQVYSTGKPMLHVPSMEVTVVNTVGAGDAFAAGLIASRLQGASWEEAARFANACGAIVVSRPGCSQALPFQNEVKQLLAEKGELP